MNLIEFESIYTDVLAYALQERFKKDLELAKSTFLIKDDQSDFLGFTEWFVFHYPLKSSGKTIVQQMASEREDALLSALSHSYRSIFELKAENDKLYALDIFTGMHFQLQSAKLDPEMLYGLRLVENDGFYEVVGDELTFEKAHKSLIKRHVLDQFNKLNTLESPMSFESFIGTNAHILYKLYDVLDAVYEENMHDDIYELHQASFALKVSVDEWLDVLSESDLTIIPDEDDALIFRLYSQESLISELEFEEHKFNLLCNNESQLTYLIQLINTIADDKAIFLSQSKYLIEDLLEGGFDN
ncbi:hypothetical protein [Fusibacter tunisiensis]|uniref:Uncharacterized protein n=1 Tax=Fusibacter tunisiensis TaxID=1008308 RepID=A0ABS2MMV5_9FIRM|nr:hypothetical protein [Fusibacter tunisiensis]MBM7560729.1 hypothetical protein [Fusibacter tunisiensis]